MDKKSKKYAKIGIESVIGLVVLIFFYFVFILFLLVVIFLFYSFINIYMISLEIRRNTFSPHKCENEFVFPFFFLKDVFMNGMFSLLLSVSNLFESHHGKTMVQMSLVTKFGTILVKLRCDTL